MYAASFDTTAQVTWAEAPTKPVDMARLQKAMFTDRPDLWPANPRKRRKAKIRAAEQASLIEDLE